MNWFEKVKAGIQAALDWVHGKQARDVATAICTAAFVTSHVTPPATLVNVIARGVLEGCVVAGVYSVGTPRNGGQEEVTQP